MTGNSPADPGADDFNPDEEGRHQRPTHGQLRGTDKPPPYAPPSPPHGKLGSDKPPPAAPEEPPQG